MLESPLVAETLAVFGVAGAAGQVHEKPAKPESVKLMACAVKQPVNAVQWVKQPQPVDGPKTPKKREGTEPKFEGFPQEPPMSVSANQTFSALADMLESAGESEIAGKL